MQIEWLEIRTSLTDAIRVALPLQIQKTAGDRIAGICLLMDACYGSSGLYLLTESAARTLGTNAFEMIGDWPISTDWNLNDNYSQAYAKHWGKWADWFNEHMNDFDDSFREEVFEKLIQISCEAMREVELAGHLSTFSKTKDFKIIIAEHDEPIQSSLERYKQFVNT